jgi:hypothetical protein
MSSSSNDPNAPNSKPEVNSTGQPLAEKAATPGVGRSSQAALLAAALAAASATPADAAVPTAAPDRAYLEALLHGSWTQPPDLNVRGRSGTEADVAPSTGEFDTAAGAFNDSFNPNPKPYHDVRYGDSAFGDRTDRTR